MAQPKTTCRPKSRLSVVALAVLFALLGAACEGFYTDSLPTPQIAMPTPARFQANDQDGNPEDIVEAGARTALAAALGINPDAPGKIVLQGATWTDRNPGCYPPPPGVSGPYLVAGYRLLMQYEGVFYEYDADLGGETGALCDSTLQLVPVEPALDTVTVNLAGSAPPDFDAVYVLRSEDDVFEFNSTQSDIAAIAVDVVDWTVEVLVGGWVNVGPNTEAVRAYRLSTESPAKTPDASADGPSNITKIVIEVAIPEDQADTADTGPSQTWALVDITEPDSTYEFVVQD